MITMEEHRKYQFMEVNLQRRMTGLNDKIPDIRKTLETVQFLKLRRVGFYDGSRELKGPPPDQATGRNRAGRDHIRA